MDEWSNEKYLEAKDYWVRKLATLEPRNDTPEEYDAFLNALDDRINECE